MIKNRIIIFGTGSIAKLLFYNLRDDTEAIAFLADNEERQNIEGIPVINFEELKEYKYDYIIIAFGDSLKGKDILIKKGISDERIVAYTYCDKTYEDNVFQNILDNLLKDTLHSDSIPLFFNLLPKKQYICTMNTTEDYNVITKDYVREQSLVFLAEEIKRRGINGNIAEIGVAQGEFAAKMNRVFSDRYLYLFDTYNGLSQDDRRKAIELGWGERTYAIKETGTPEEIVLNRMPNPSLCIVKKGYFPDNYDLDDELAFVSLDIDFYDTIRKGLEVIYPHISKGGYIMVHDFHNLAFPESRQAVIDFCDINEISYVPITDNGGSVVIVK